ncbi:ArdC family protein [Corallococcus sp. AB038B]|uniref:ArdC family protein n=1 Tax=Corallococcus sp. AB038B TaxID=2316718 RepID=UPI000ECEF60E|nr:ArdC family protein [Corallococcus sp. AB038B]RKH92964.1 hypothetical protein D7Y04_41825 [Corallococcus sp. AB038B]
MSTKTDSAKWAAEREEKLAKARESLDAGLRALVTGEDWKRTLNGLAILGPLSISRLSFTNILLLLLQRPDATYAATFEGWKKVGRSVRKGERGAVIRAPWFRKAKGDAKDEPTDGTGDESNPQEKRRVGGMRPLHLFALQQTDGAELPRVSCQDVTGPEAFERSVEVMRDVALTIPGSPVSSVTLRAHSAELGDRPGVRGWFDRSTREIVVFTNDRDRPAIFRTLCHEVAHSLLHGLDDHHSSPEREVEAESTAYVVCHALGLDTGSYSFPYVATWSTGLESKSPTEAVEASGARILSAARTILAALAPQEDEARLMDAAA